MINDKLPTLAQFFGAYFHQGWDVEAHDALGVIRNYLDDEPTSIVQQTIKEIEQLLTINLDEEQLKNLLESNLSCYYDPTVYGISHSDWLHWIQVSLKQGTSGTVVLSP